MDDFFFLFGCAGSSLLSVVFLRPLSAQYSTSYREHMKKDLVFALKGHIVFKEKSCEAVGHSKL